MYLIQLGMNLKQFIKWNVHNFQMFSIIYRQHFRLCKPNTNNLLKPIIKINTTLKTSEGVKRLFLRGGKSGCGIGTAAGLKSAADHEVQE